MKFNVVNEYVSVVQSQCMHLVAWRLVCILVLAGGVHLELTTRGEGLEERCQYSQRRNVLAWWRLWALGPNLWAIRCKVRGILPVKYILPYLHTYCCKGL